MSQDSERNGDSVPRAQATEFASPNLDDLNAAETAIEEDWKAGDVILDLYEVKGVLGEGGFGKVYRVHHTGWNIDLAVKTPRLDRLDEVGKANFRTEAETWVSLGLHPHTVGCYYVRDLGGIPRVFAEFVDGGSLSDWIRDGRLYEAGPERALERMLDIAIQFAWGLHYAHEQGLVHQDVKPANVMVAPDGTAKVTDFGLARAGLTHDGRTGEPASENGLMTNGGMTPAYASPEQAAGRSLSRATDIWSWGVSVLEMFSGEVTWLSGSAALGVLEDHLESAIDDPRIPSMPERLATLLRDCFRHDPALRPQTMLQVAGELQQIYVQMIGADHPRQSPKPADFTADALNNRALSLLDLGKETEAIAIWETALSRDPHHCASIYNRGLVQWRCGQQMDDLIVEQLNSAREPQSDQWEPNYLLGLVHFERGDFASARPLFERALELAPTETAIRDYLGRLSSDGLTEGKCVQRLAGHASEVNSMAISRDGRVAASASGHHLPESDNSVRLWAFPAGRSLGTIANQKAPVSSVALDRSGTLMLTGSADARLRIWEVATGQSLRVIESHEHDRINSCALSDDGRYALAGSADGTLTLWEVATGRRLQTLRGKQIERRSDGIWLIFVNSVCFRADGRRAVSGHRDGMMRLWEIPSGRCVLELKARANVDSVSLSADGTRLFSCGGTYRQLWDVSTGQCLQEIVEPTGPGGEASMSGDGRLAVSTDPLRVWDLERGRCLRTLDEPDNRVSSAVLSSDGKWCASGDRDGEVQFWQLPRYGSAPFHLSRITALGALQQTERELEQLLRSAESAFDDFDLRSGQALVRQARTLPGHKRTPKTLDMWGRAALRSRRVGLNDAWLSKELTVREYGPRSVCFSADGRIALAADNHWIGLWQLPEFGLLQQIEVVHQTITSNVALSFDGRWALAGLDDGGIGIWDVQKGNLARTFAPVRMRGRTASLTSVSLSGDGRWVLGARGGSVYMWEFASGRCLLHLPPDEPDAEVVGACISPDGGSALVGYYRAYDVHGETQRDDLLRLWDLGSQQVVRDLTGEDGQIRPVDFGTDGRTAYSIGSRYNVVHKWDLSTGQCIYALDGSARSPRLTADGRWLLGITYDGLAVWDTSVGRKALTINYSEKLIVELALSPDGRFLLASCNQGALHLWELDWELEAVDPADWDEGARPYLNTFLSRYTPSVVVPKIDEPIVERTNEETSTEFVDTVEVPHSVVEEARLIRHGAPQWSEGDFPSLLYTLGCAGFGWLRPAGVRRQLEVMKSELSESLAADRSTASDSDRKNGFSSWLQRIWKR